jgi:signal transduction histidine kinase
MKRTGIIAAAFVVVGWLGLAEWQRREYVHQRDLIRTALSGQAESIVNVLVSSVHSHRWIGPFFKAQLPGTLEELAASGSVLVVAIVAVDDPNSRGGTTTTGRDGGRDAVKGPEVYAAGDVNLLTVSDAAESTWREAGYYVIRDFEMNANSVTGAAMHGRGGFGPGGRPPWMSEDDEPPATHFKAMLVLDRSGTDTQLDHEVWNRVMLVLSGGLLLILFGVSWRTTVRLADAQGRARVLQVESRHLTELGQAAAGLAHETRNPLGLIRGWTQRLADRGLPTPEQQQQANAIIEECDRVTSRINEFLAFARPAEPQLAPVPIRQLVEQLGVLLESDLEARSLKLDLEGVPPDAVVRADSEQLRQAIFNLVQNAVAFAAEGGLVTIRMIRGRQRTWRLEVADDGLGPSPETVDSLFEPYFTTRTEGTGLGLAIVQRIVLAHRWSVGHSLGNDGCTVFWIDQIRSA